MKKNKGKKKSTTRKPVKKDIKARYSFAFKFLTNIFYIFLGVTMVYLMYSKNSGYNWLYGSLIKGTLDNRAQISELTMDQRIEIKLGFDVKYLNFLRDNTPDTAVILFPNPDSIRTEKDGGNFSDNRYLSSKTWATYFIYPRKMVYESQLEELEQISHVAIIDFWGYKYFPNFPTESRSEFNVIPLKQ